MNDMIQKYVDEISAGLTDEAMDALCDYGDGEMPAYNTRLNGLRRANRKQRC